MFYFFPQWKKGQEAGISHAVSLLAFLKVLPYHLPVSVFTNTILPGVTAKSSGYLLVFLQASPTQELIYFSSPLLQPCWSCLDCHNQHVSGLPGPSFTL